MAALTSRRNTRRKGGEAVTLEDPLGLEVAAGEVIYQGALVVVNASGYAEAATTATGKKAVGVALDTFDNSGGSDGGESSAVDTKGDTKVRLNRGTHRFANSSAGDEIVQADLYSLCYIVDDQTVAKTDGTSTRSVAGMVMGIDSDGVWVHICPEAHA